MMKARAKPDDEGMGIELVDLMAEPDKDESDGAGGYLSRTVSPLIDLNPAAMNGGDVPLGRYPSDEIANYRLSTEVQIVVAEESPRPLGPVLAAEEYRPHSDFMLPEQIDAEQVDLQPDVIGEGRFGRVRAGLLSDGKGRRVRVAVKMLSGLKDSELEAFEKEIAVLQHVGRTCSNVCRLYGTCWLEKQLCIVMKRYETSLDQLMDAEPGRKIPVRRAVELMKGVSQALAELHEQHVIVHDLKPSNILVDEFGQAIIADFGVSTICQTQSMYTPTHAGTMKGTFNYMCAEAFDPASFGGVTYKADMWSFGCTLLELLSGRVPWEGINDPVIMNFVLNKKEHPPIPADLQPCLQELLRELFHATAAERPTARQAFEKLQTLQQELPSADEVRLSAEEKRMAKWVREDLGITNITDDNRFVEVVCQRLNLGEASGSMRDTLLKAQAIILRDTRDLELEPSNQFSGGYFLSHNQGKSGPAVMRLKNRMERSCPELRGRLWYDKDNKPTEDEMRLGIKRCTFFLLYLSSEVLQRPFVRKEIRWAVHYHKKIVLVWEQEGENAVGSFGTFFDDCNVDVYGDTLTDLTGPLFGQNVAIPYFSDEDFGAVSLAQILKEGAYDTQAEALLQPHTITMPAWAHANVVYCPVEGEGQAMSIKDELEQICPQISGRVETFQTEMVSHCTLVVFVTKGVFENEDVVASMRNAQRNGNNVTLVVETDERHSGAPMDDITQCPSQLLHTTPTDLLQLVRQSKVVPFYKDSWYRRVALYKVLESMTDNRMSVPGMPDANDSTSRRSVKKYGCLAAAALLLVATVVLFAIILFEQTSAARIQDGGNPIVGSSNAGACDFEDSGVSALQHVKRVCGTAADDQQRVPVGTECTVTCNEGYRASIGSQFVYQGKRTCQDTMVWTGLLPTCQAESCTHTEAPTASHVSCTGKTGDECVLSCNSGYSAVGDTSLVCDGVDHAFKGTGSCEDIDECATGNGGCVPGVEVCTNSPGSFDCLTCVDGFSRGNGRNWTTTPCSPRCVEGGHGLKERCVFPFSYANRAYNDCTGEQLPADLEVGSTWCSTGPNPASDYKKCVDCSTALTCPELVAPTHGTLKSYPSDARPFAFGTTYSLQCDAGYAYGGPVHRSCTFSQSWNTEEASTCENRCTDSGEVCQFPFRLNGVAYFDCTTDVGPKGTEGSAWCATGDDARSQFAKCVPCTQVDCGALDDTTVQGHYTQQCNSTLYSKVGTCEAQCDAGYYDASGSLARSHATCGKDYHWHWVPGNPQCRKCPHGTFAPTGSTSCAACLPGTYDGDLDPATPCLECAPGSMTNKGADASATSCEICTPGRYTADSTTSCRDCPAGHMTDTLNHPRATTCTACQPGDYSRISIERCALCPIGHATDNAASEGSSRCTICAAGQYSQTSTEPCRPCAAGLFNDTSGAVQCSSCSPGSATNTLAEAGASSCEPCPAGKYSSESVAACRTCQGGYVTDTLANPGAVSCAACQPGQFTPSSQSELGCQECEPGHATNTQVRSGASTCTICQPGMFSPDSTVSCRPCAAGLFNDTSGAVQCSSCSPGSATNTLAEAGASSCEPCPAGKYSSESVAACRTCQGGYVTDTLANPGAVSCAACSRGRFSASPVQACRACPPGSTVDKGMEAGSSSCTACSVGTFSADPTHACVSCPHATHARSTGSISCTSCTELYSIDCGDHGECQDAVVPPTPQGVGAASGACRCSSEYYTGKYCEIHDPCEDWSCGDHGTCSSVALDAGVSIPHCVCEPGYGGGRCDKSPCDRVDCGTHGTCRVTATEPSANINAPPCDVDCTDSKTPTATASCVCSDGYSGTQCQTADPCHNVQCNHGTCSSGICHCNSGYLHSDCSVRDPCYNVRCVHGSCSGGTCHCDSEYTSSDCSVPRSHSCPSYSSWDSYEARCVCDSGYEEGLYGCERESSGYGYGYSSSRRRSSSGGYGYGGDGGFSCAGCGEGVNFDGCSFECGGMGCC